MCPPTHLTPDDCLQDFLCGSGLDPEELYARIEIEPGEGSWQAKLLASEKAETPLALVSHFASDEEACDDLASAGVTNVEIFFDEAS